ncbi:MAG: CHAT domain-containing protein [Piscirickettsiaceae bacterium]|nr:CHAT domain-containing protein [Piscirickettsiaceae bacterium]
MIKEQPTSKKRPLLLILLLLLLLTVYINKDKLGTSPNQITAVSQVTKSKQLTLDDETKTEIRAYFSDIKVNPEQYSIAYATKLDYGTGRKLLIAGKNREAYPVYQKIMAISYDQGSLMGVSIGLGALSNIMHKMGQKDEAIKLAMLEYKVSRALGQRFEYGVTQQRIAILMEKEGRSLAMSWRLRARESLKGTPHKQDYVGLLVNTARDFDRLKRPDDALSMYKEAYELGRTLGHSPAHRKSFLRAARWYMIALNSSEKYQNSIDVGLIALGTIKEDIRSTALHYDLLYQMGESYRGLNDPLQASGYFGTAYRHYEESRANALGDKARAKLDNNNWTLINRLIDSYIDQSDYHQALAILESNKARTLSDIADDSNQQFIYKELTALNRQHAKQRAEFFDPYRISLEGAVEQALNPEPIDTKKELKQLADSYEELLEKQAQEITQLKISSQIRDVAISRSVSAKQIREIQENLNAEQAIISIYARRDSVAVILMSRHSIYFHKSSLSYDDANRVVKQLQAALLNPAVDFYIEPAQYLSNQLIQPLLPKIPSSVKTLIYSADATFPDIPIGVLPVGNQYLAERFGVARVPSLRLFNVEKDLKKQNATQGISCVDPEIVNARLIFQRETGEALQQLYGNQLVNLVGKDCSANQLEKAISVNHTPAFLHIGAHGNFYKTNAMKSGLLLSPVNNPSNFEPSDVWNAEAIGAVDLSSINLVTIASREAALTDVTLRRDLFGLMRTLLFGGVDKVVAPLWAVQDQSTSLLMQYFYQGYKKGLTPRKALQKAQIALIKNSKFAHPFYWSGFVITEVSL